MLSHAHRTQWVAPAVTVALVAAVAGALLWVDAQPEYHRVESTDGVVTVEGLFPSDLSVAITEDKSASSSLWTAAVSKIYVIEPDDVLLPSPATITFHLNLFPIDTVDVPYMSIGYYNTDRGMWMPLPSDRDPDGAINAKTNHFSHWALIAPSPLIPEADRDALINDALSAAPANAHAYSVDMAYATVEGDFVLIEEDVQADRCAETSVGRTQRVTTTTDRPAAIYVNDEARAATLRAVIHWETGSPCPDLLQ